MPKSKAQVFVKGYAVSVQTRYTRKTGGVNDLPVGDQVEGPSGRVATGEIVYVDGSLSQKLGVLNLSFPADAKDKDVDAAATAAAKAMVKEHGLDETTDVTLEK